MTAFAMNAYLAGFGTTLSLIVPANSSARPDTVLALDGMTIDQVHLTHLLERGTDYVHYACHI